MSGFILCVEGKEDNLEGLVELIGLDGFDVHKANSLEAAREALEMCQVDLMLIGLNFLPDHKHEGVKFVNDPAYIAIAKVILLVDSNDRWIPSLDGDTAAVTFSYIGEPQWLEKLKETLESLLGR